MYQKYTNNLIGGAAITMTDDEIIVLGQKERTIREWINKLSEIKATKALLEHEGHDISLLDIQILKITEIIERNKSSVNLQHNLQEYLRNNFTCVKLKEELKKRARPITGKKAELIDRLMSSGYTLDRVTSHVTTPVAATSVHATPVPATPVPATPVTATPVYATLPEPAPVPVTPSASSHQKIMLNVPISTLPEIHQTDHKTLVLFDIDETLVWATRGWVTCPDGKERFTKKLELFVKNIPTLLTELNEKGSSVFGLTARYATDPEGPQVQQQWQQSIEMNYYDDHEETKKALAGASINLSQYNNHFFPDWTSDVITFDTGKKIRQIFTEGILYAGNGTIKGEDTKLLAFKNCFEDLLNVLDITKIIYVDDKLKHTEPISEYFKTLDINTVVVKYNLGLLVKFKNNSVKEEGLTKQLEQEGIRRLRNGEDLEDILFDFRTR